MSAHVLLNLLNVFGKSDNFVTFWFKHIYFLKRYIQIQ